jgi:hypothetical protein
MKKWKHKDYLNRVYTGFYVKVKDKKVFRLRTVVNVLIKKITYKVDFKSWQEAVKKGWTRE